MSYRNGERVEPSLDRRNQLRGKRIRPERGPINGEDRVYTWRGDQSTDRNEYIPGEGTNQLIGTSI
eukprot:6449276-Pyramimonas_sp.AAC.1